MPSFQMPEKDAAALVDYFAALDDKLQPYVHFDKSQVKREAMKAARDIFQKAECLSCHGVYPPPPGKEAPTAPNLSFAKQRLRPEWIVDWIANPQKVRPGTKMPIFFEGAGMTASILSGVRGEKADGRWTYNLKTAEEAELPEEQLATLRIGPKTVIVKVEGIDEKTIKITSPEDIGAKFGRAEIESHGEPVDEDLLGGDGYRQIRALRDFLMSENVSSLPIPGKN
jgi:mono/diheme cytochrome c family protein